LVLTGIIEAWVWGMFFTWSGNRIWVQRMPLCKRIQHQKCPWGGARWGTGTRTWCSCWFTTLKFVFKILNFTTVWCAFNEVHGDRVNYMYMRKRRNEEMRKRINDNVKEINHNRNNLMHCLRWLQIVSNIQKSDANQTDNRHSLHMHASIWRSSGGKGGVTLANSTGTPSVTCSNRSWIWRYVSRFENVEWRDAAKARRHISPPP